MDNYVTATKTDARKKHSIYGTDKNTVILSEKPLWTERIPDTVTNLREKLEPTKQGEFDTFTKSLEVLPSTRIMIFKSISKIIYRKNLPPNVLKSNPLALTDETIEPQFKEVNSDNVCGILKNMKDLFYLDNEGKISSGLHRRNHVDYTDPKHILIVYGVDSQESAATTTYNIALVNYEEFKKNQK